jgi:hypothetical protein
MPGSGVASGVTPSALQSAAMAPYGLNVSMPAAYPPVLVPITGAQTVGFGAKSLGASNAMSPFAAVPGDARMPARAPGTGGGCQLEHQAQALTPNVSQGPRGFRRRRQLRGRREQQDRREQLVPDPQQH